MNNKNEYITFNISNQYTDAPGGRYIKDGKYSGEHFRESVLEKLLSEALNKNKKLLIDLDGVYGYATSFLDESFGKLAGLNPQINLENIIIFKSQDLPSLSDEIYGYMKEHKNEK